MQLTEILKNLVLKFEEYFYIKFLDSHQHFYFFIETRRGRRILLGRERSQHVGGRRRRFRRRRPVGLRRRRPPAAAPAAQARPHLGRSSGRLQEEKEAPTAVGRRRFERRRRRRLLRRRLVRLLRRRSRRRLLRRTAADLAGWSVLACLCVTLGPHPSPAFPQALPVRRSPPSPHHILSWADNSPDLLSGCRLSSNLPRALCALLS